MLTERQAFKVAFLEKCAEQGLTLAETHELVKSVKQAIAEKQAADEWWNPLTYVNSGVDTAKNIAGLGVPALALAAGVPLLAGGALGYGAGALVGSAGNDEDVKDVKTHDQIEAYRHEIERARVKNLLAERRKRMGHSSYSRGI